MIVLLRGLAIIAGLGGIGAVTYGTVEATGGFTTNYAAVYIALGVTQAVLAMALGAGLVRGRLLALTAVALLVMCEAANFLATVDLQLTAAEDAAAPIHDASAKRMAAEDWVARLERDDRVQRAERALRDAQADARTKSTDKGCGQNCRAILAKTVDDATAAVANAQASLQLEKRQARAALDKAPLPPSATPLADKTGWQAWMIDLAKAGLRGFGLALGSAILLAAGAHRRQPEFPTPTVPKPAKVPVTKAVGSVSKWMLEATEAQPAAKAEWGAMLAAYRLWCQAHDFEAVTAEVFAESLNVICERAGIETNEKGGKVYCVDLKLIGQPKLKLAS